MRSAVFVQPPSKTESVVEFLHGIEVTDPYRWLEQQDAPQTRKWIEDQTAYTRAYFEAVPGRKRIRTRIENLLELKGVISEPWNVSGRFFCLKRQAQSEQPAIIMRTGLFGEEKILIDPAQRGTGTNTAVSIVAISDDAGLLAFAVREGGTDHSRLEILDVKRNSILPDGLTEGLCNGFAFAPDATGFYYSHRQLHDRSPNYRAVYWHPFGADPADDREMLFAGEQADLFVGVLPCPEAALLAYPVFSTGKARRTSLYLHKLPHSVHEPILLIENIAGCFVPFFVKDQLFAYTDFLAPNFRIVRIEIESPDPALWQDVVPESPHRIQQFAVAGDQVFVTRVDRFTTQLDAFSPFGDGNNDAVKSIFGSIDLLNCNMNSDGLFYGETSMTEPSSVHRYDTVTKTSFPCEPCNPSFNEPRIITHQIVYPSFDGTSIPLLLSFREDINTSLSLPTFLTGYGGFGSCVTPRFTAFATFLIEQGFLFAVPALRGGAELGEEWHQAGMRHQRQNSFDDFIACAEWLITNGYSAAGRIAIGGGSNAGLLVGAAITQRPELFRAAICLGPLLDMLRYHLFDFAAGWSDEYGTADDERDCKYLMDYSPYHKVRDDVAYPAVLLISGDADTRCNPMHARKMTARLQAATTSDHPILLDYKTAWGHTPVQPRSVRLDALTDRLAFVCHELGVAVAPE
jgi:prolyl oligopeptidase